MCRVGWPEQVEAAAAAVCTTVQWEQPFDLSVPGVGAVCGGAYRWWAPVDRDRSSHPFDGWSSPIVIADLLAAYTGGQTLTAVGAPGTTSSWRGRRCGYRCGVARVAGVSGSGGGAHVDRAGGSGGGGGGSRVIMWRWCPLSWRRGAGVARDAVSPSCHDHPTAWAVLVADDRAGHGGVRGETVSGRPADLRVPIRWSGCSSHGAGGGDRR